MYFYLTGVDYKSAPLSARENIYRKRKGIIDFWQSRHPGKTEALFTCNRIEICGVAESHEEAFKNVAEFNRVFPDFSRRAYFKYGKDEIFRHGLRLACGLESQLHGELQILSQLEAWSGKESFNPALKEFWQEIIFLSEKIRGETGLDTRDDNIAPLVYHDFINRRGPLGPFKVIVAGTGKIAELFARYRMPQAYLSFVAHKNYVKAESLARASGGKAYGFEDLAELLLDADMFVSATSSPHHILGKSHFKEAVSSRAHELYVYDLAVPRDIEPEVAGLDGILLNNLEDLDRLFKKRNIEKKDRINVASDLIENAVRERSEAVYVG
ncbi:MAG: hypothetical protein Q8O12_04165 [Candidatus Omnitrophota bacterium]|nr:hypothetical protein [Candidatus Omnitrophota bacterium]